MSDRAAYFAKYNADRRAKRAKPAPSTGNYPSLVTCQAMTDEQVTEAYAARGVQPKVIRRFEVEECIHPGTGEVYVTTPEYCDEQDRKIQRSKLFSLGLADWIATLDDATVISQLQALNPKEFPAEMNTRHMAVKDLRDNLQHELWHKEYVACPI